MTDRVKHQGVVTTRTCPTCGHHEVGITTDEGVFVPLEPGQRVWVLDSAPGLRSMGERFPVPECGVPVSDSVPAEAEPVAWAPAPLMTTPSLRRAFGVLLPACDPPERLPEAYEPAYLTKLADLIAREELGSRAMLLDQYFAAPHIATGYPEEIARRLWIECEEIRVPALLVESWLKGEEGDLLGKARALCRNPDEAESPVPDPEALGQELRNLSLEEFLGWIA